MVFVVQTLNAISKSVSTKMSPLLEHLIKFIIGDIQKIREKVKKIDDVDYTTHASELLDLYISTIENLVKGCPKEIATYLNDIVQISAELLEFDPNNTAIIDEQDEMEIEGNSTL